MLAAERALGRGHRRAPFLARALSIARHSGEEAQFLLEDVGPGTRRLCELQAGERVLGVGPLGRGFSAAGAGPAGAAGRRRRRDRAADDPAGQPRGAARALLGFRDGERARAAELMLRRPRSPPTTAPPGTTERSPSCSSASSQRTAQAEVYACGPGADARGRAGAVRAVRVPAQLALEAPMACGFGACFGCVVPARDGSYLRVCVDGPVIDAARARPRRRVRRGARVSVDFCGLELAHPVINGSGTFDAIAAARGLRRGPAGGLPVRRLRLQDDHAGAPRGQPAAADLGGAGGDDQLDRPAQQGTRRLPARVTCPTCGYHHARARSRWRAPGRAPDHERDGLQRRGAAGAGGGVRAAPADRRRRAQRVLPERADRASTSAPTPSSCGRCVGELRGRHRQAADRQAHPQRRRRAGVRAGRRGGGRGRGLADQHAAGDGARPGAPTAHARGRGWEGRTGGLSGPAVRAVALAQVAAVAERVRIPVVGMGGVQSGAHARELLDVGASLVAVGTESFRDPAAGRRIARELHDAQSAAA